jgi:hypothetical protein
MTWGLRAPSPQIETSVQGPYTTTYYDPVTGEPTSSSVAHGPGEAGQIEAFPGVQPTMTDEYDLSRQTHTGARPTPTYETQPVGVADQEGNVTELPGTWHKKYLADSGGVHGILAAWNQMSHGQQAEAWMEDTGIASAMPEGAQLIPGYKYSTWSGNLVPVDASDVMNFEVMAPAGTDFGNGMRPSVTTEMWQQYQDYMLEPGNEGTYSGGFDDFATFWNENPGGGLLGGDSGFETGGTELGETDPLGDEYWASLGLGPYGGGGAEEPTGQGEELSMLLEALQSPGTQAGGGQSYYFGGYNPGSSPWETPLGG